MSGEAAVRKQIAPENVPASAPAEETPGFLCPACGGKYLRRSHRTGPFERLRGLFGYYPYRCHSCVSRPFIRTGPNLLQRIIPGR